MSAELFDLMIKDMKAKKASYLEYTQREKPALTQRITLDLSKTYTENDPYFVNFAFKSVFVERATDTSCEIYLKAVSKDDSQKPFKMTLKDSWSQDFQIPRCFLHWTVQPGKTMDLIFFSDSEFRSGSQISVTSGGVTVTEGTSFTRSVLAITGAAAAVIVAPLNTSRTVSTILNDSSDYLYLGEAGVTDSGATKGIPVGPGEMFQWKNTSALYGYMTTSGNIIQLHEAQ